MDVEPRTPNADAHPDPTPAPTPEPPEPPARRVEGPQRLFLHEPGWSVALKVGSERVFCYQIAPGEDYYHRLNDGEIFLYHGDERLCLPCASRRGLLSFEPRGLREPAVELSEFEDVQPSSDYELKE